MTLKQHANVDALNRLPLFETPAQTTVPAKLVLMIENLWDAPISAEQRDLKMAKVLKYIHEGWPSNVEGNIKPY